MKNSIIQLQVSGEFEQLKPNNVDISIECGGGSVEQQPT
jgi:hypothetical protein